MPTPLREQIREELDSLSDLVDDGIFIADYRREADAAVTVILRAVADAMDDEMSKFRAYQPKVIVDWLRSQ